MPRGMSGRTRRWSAPNCRSSTSGRRLTPHERTVLLFTALFHDAGKPLTSQVDPATGGSRRRSTPSRGSIWHGRCCGISDAIWRFGKRSPGWFASTGVRRSCWRSPTRPTRSSRSRGSVSNRLLYLFALADTRGRTTAEMGRPEENLHLWKLVAEENGCFDQPYPFANDHARFLFYRQERAEPALRAPRGLPLHGDDACRACPAAARTPGSRRIAPTCRWSRSTTSGANSTSMPTRRPRRGASRSARERCREHLRAGRSFAFNATNLLRQTRERWIDLFADYGARIEIVYLEPPLSVILGQNGRRPTPVPETGHPAPRRQVRAADPRRVARTQDVGSRHDFVARTQAGSEPSMKITIPKLSLVVLIGPSGSGKSTFARKHFLPTEVLSSDACRGLVCDDENDQAVTNDAFEVLHFIAAKRLALGG